MPRPTPNTPEKRPLILSHDGSVDDLLALLLVTTLEGYTLQGVIVTDGDCHGEPALEASRKILDLAGVEGVEVALSEARAVHSFPAAWRLDCLRINGLPILNEPETVQTRRSPLSGVDFLISLLERSPRPVTFLEVGPLSTLSLALRRRPDLAARLSQVLWMGGALRVGGNVSGRDEPLHDGTAEWNAYWDAPAARHVLGLGLPITLCPLDLTDTVPVSDGFMRVLARQRRHRFSDLAGQCYALIAYRTYTVWDVLTTAYLGAPELFGTALERISIETSGASEGRTRPDPQGSSVTVLTEVHHQAFWDWLAGRFARS